MKLPVTITVNGRVCEREVEPRLLLVHFLRDVAGLTGTQGRLRHQPVRRVHGARRRRRHEVLHLLAVQADGAAVTTIEGLARERQLHPLQEAFWEKHGLQCGFCTPGMILARARLLAPTPTRPPSRCGTALEGNLCRCTGYQNIVRAVAAGRVALGERRERDRSHALERFRLRASAAARIRASSPAPRVHGRHRAARHGARRHPAQPARARAHHAHRHSAAPRPRPAWSPCTRGRHRRAC